MTRRLFSIFVLLPALAGADEVFTRGGGQLTGEIVDRRPSSIVVDVGGGTIELPLSFVDRIVPGPSPLAQYRQKVARLAPDDAPGWVALGEWARKQDLRSEADEAFAHAVSLDPGNAAAHQALGHVKVADRWMSGEEGHRARGLVRFDGRWMTPEDRQLLLAERTTAAEQAAAEAEAVARVRESEARAREAEARARIAEATARVAEVDAVRAEFASRSLQWVPVSPGLAPLTFASARGFFTGCARGGLVVRQPGLRHVAGRGGAFVVSEDLRVTIRH